jgi:ribosome-binding factor A
VAHSTHNRPQRVGDLIQRALAELLLREAQDPRFQQVTITAVDVSPDLSNASVYISILNIDQIKETLQALNKAAGYFRHKLADAVDLRIMPHLRFVFDESISRADRISKLIDDALQPASSKKPKE